RGPILRLLSAMAAAFLGLSSARADPPPPRGAPRALKLAEALAFARAHKPQIQAAKARLAAAQADTAIPGSQWFPLVGASAQLLYGTANNTTASYASARVLDIPRIGGTKANVVTFQPYPSTLVGVGITQELFDFGRIAAQRAVFEAGVEIEKLSA